MSKKFLGPLLGLSCALVLALHGAPAKAAVFSTGQPSGYYGTSTCMDVNGGSLANGTAVQAYSCTAAMDQQFEFAGSYSGTQGTTIYLVGGQRCLDVKNAGTQPGTKVDSFTCNGTAAQRWYYYNGQVINLNGNNLCLDSGSGANGTQLVINTCNGTESQQWQIK